MKITLFRDLKEENWHSMSRYADALASAFKVQGSRFKVNEFVVPRQRLTPSHALNLYYTRYLYYPLKARGQQGEVNHIVDHSYGHLVYALNPKKTVVTCHDLNPLKHEESWLNLALFKVSLGGLKRAAKIIVDSKATKKDLIKFLKIDPDKIRVIPLGVEEKFRVIEDKEKLSRIKKKYGLPNSKIILHVGGSAYNKNIEGVINAISNLKSQISNIFFIKIGSDFTELQKTLIRKLELDECVKFLGEVSEEELPVLYNLADCLVFPSFYEGFGLPILEAMASGVPVVTSNTSSMPEVAGDAAILVDPHNVEGIARGISKVLLSDDSSYQRMIQKGLERAKKFTWRKTAEETLKVYEELL